MQRSSVQWAEWAAGIADGDDLGAATVAGIGEVGVTSAEGADIEEAHGEVSGKQDGQGGTGSFGPMRLTIAPHTATATEP
ncbi:hypothetical protein [Actinoalloteichus hymeniacidonis]|uniref:hypothetical protein n=1 Tax=Actinoalloteichus hymeniacidonis TaxID=340345 RepID=UPI0012F9D39C|nr:hypothetical protein [Actinoalloteichus hymeniacidonis]MBB5907286.1 hypothetical protein [Actinoalloteichus hymeniacidonis]